MARSVFYSFHFKDIFRVMVVRKRWVTYGGQRISGVIDHTEFDKIKQKGDGSVKQWINQQLNGTTATVVLIGEETLNRPYVQYEIQQSIARGNAVIGVYINTIKDINGNTCNACHRHVMIDNSFFPVYFDEIADGIYDYIRQDGYRYLDSWVETAVYKKKIQALLK